MAADAGGMLQPPGPGAAALFADACRAGPTVWTAPTAVGAGAYTAIRRSGRRPGGVQRTGKRTVIKVLARCHGRGHGPRLRIGHRDLGAVLLGHLAHDGQPRPLPDDGVGRPVEG